VAAILRLAENVLLDYEVQQSGYGKILEAKWMVLQSDEKYHHCTDTIICCV